MFYRSKRNHSIFVLQPAAGSWERRNQGSSPKGAKEEVKVVLDADLIYETDCPYGKSILGTESIHAAQQGPARVDGLDALCQGPKTTWPKQKLIPNSVLVHGLCGRQSAELVFISQARCFNGRVFVPSKDVPQVVNGSLDALPQLLPG